MTENRIDQPLEVVGQRPGQVRQANIAEAEQVEYMKSEVTLNDTKFPIVAETFETRRQRARIHVERGHDRGWQRRRVLGQKLV